MIRVILPYPPLGNRYFRIYRGRAVTSPEAREYKTRVGWLMAGQTPVAGPVRVTLHVYRPWKRGDLDGAGKVLLDALQGHAYANDNQIVELVMRRDDDKARPRVEVTIESCP